jgi:hypothetical protein
MDPARRHPLEAQDVAFVRLGVAAVLEVLGTAIEGHELLEQPVIGRDLAHGSAARIAGNHVASLDQVCSSVRLGRREREETGDRFN